MEDDFLKDFPDCPPLKSARDHCTYWEEEIAAEIERSKLAGEQHPNIGEDFIWCVRCLRAALDHIDNATEV